MDILDLERKLGIEGISADEQMALVDALQKSAAQKLAKAKVESIGKSADLVIQGLKKIKSDIESRFDDLNVQVQQKANSVRDGRDGKDGKDGKPGSKGDRGFDGTSGAAGINGRDGKDGLNGISVSNARIDFDGGLVITLSNGNEIDCGEVVPPDVAEKIKVITNGGGTSQYVLDTLASLQTQISAITGGLQYQGTWNASTNSPALASSVGTVNFYYVVSVAGSTNLNGITDWVAGDWAIYNGTVWQKIDQTNLVVSVAGRTGAIVLTTVDVGGLGTMATQAALSVAITGGSITGITDLALADGGTAASTAADARTNLGLVIGTDVLAPTGSAASLTSFPTFNQNTTGNAATVTTNANLTGVITSVGNATSIASQTGTGVKFVVDTSPSLVTPNLGTPASGTLTNCTFPTLNQNTTGTAASAPKFLSANFTIEESAGKLIFKYGATTIASMSSTGLITSAANIAANGTP